jgi:hypothetical protein
VALGIPDPDAWELHSKPEPRQVGRSLEHEPLQVHQPRHDYNKELFTNYHQDHIRGDDVDGACSTRVRQMHTKFSSEI